MVPYHSFTANALPDWAGCISPHCCQTGDTASLGKPATQNRKRKKANKKLRKCVEDRSERGIGNGHQKLRSCEFLKAVTEIGCGGKQACATAMRLSVPLGKQTGASRSKRRRREREREKEREMSQARRLTPRSAHCVCSATSLAPLTHFPLTLTPFPPPLPRPFDRTYTRHTGAQPREQDNGVDE